MAKSLSREFENYLVQLEDRPLLRLPVSTEIQRSITAINKLHTKRSVPVLVVTGRIHYKGELINDDIDVLIDPKCPQSFIHSMHIAGDSSYKPYAYISEKGLGVDIHRGLSSKQPANYLQVADISPYDCILGQDWLSTL